MLAGFAVLLAACPASGQSWLWHPSIGLQETLTNNVNLSGPGTQQSDLVTQITPTLEFEEKGDHTKLHGVVALPVLLYAKTGAENNQVYPLVDMLGDVTLLDRLLHIEGAVQVSQQYLNPFGSQQQDLTNPTNNRYQSELYRVTPYIGDTTGNVTWEVRNNSIWSNLGSTPFDTSNSYTNEWIATASNTEARAGWRAKIDYSDTKFTDQGAIRTALGRFEPIYNYDPQLRLIGRIGYEDNHYQLTSSQNVIYGAGFVWHPDERTNVAGDWEYRFFGSSYLFTLDHRTPLSIFSVNVSRNITTYPQQIATLQPGTSVFATLDQLFQSRYPDPVARQQAIEQFINDRGLPSTLSGPVNLYAQQILLQQSQSVSAGLIGARNSIMLTVFNVKTSTIAGSGTPLPLPFDNGNNNTQTGVDLVWTHKLTEATVLTASADGSRTVATPPFVGKTNQGILRLYLTTPLSGRTNLYMGARYQALLSDIAPDYHEVAGYIGFITKFN
ncbi:MAG TPA: TIGR03016 family PEP-CTERM system-associated outer membrane protein [Casimicrobiaceae bacterium]|nr:TIGR03016 family PEP-CTERM system-associated outer membrane protein [Casimicrobiaceae bacterium]